MIIRSRRVLPIAVALLIVAAATAATAATIGSLSTSSLNGYQAAQGSGAKTVYLADGFTGASGTDLNGRALLVGGTWTAVTGTWTIDGSNQATNTSAKVVDRLVAAAGQADTRTIATIMDPPAGDVSSGVIVRSNAAATTYLWVFAEKPNVLRLAKVTGGTSTNLALGTITPTDPASMVVECNGPSVTVSYNGTAVLTYTLTAAEQATYGALGSYGLINDNKKGKQVNYDDFRVESL